MKPKGQIEGQTLGSDPGSAPVGFAGIPGAFKPAKKMRHALWRMPH